VIAIEDPNTSLALSTCLQAVGCSVVSVAGGPGAAEELKRHRFEVAFVDARFGVEPSLEPMPRLLAAARDVMVIVVTSQTIEGAAAESLRRGAWDFLRKPFTAAEVHHLIDRVVSARTLRARARELQQRLDLEAPSVLLSSEAPVMQDVLEMLGRAGRSDLPVLLCGEKGSGKKALAWALHRDSLRAEGPFVLVSCATGAEKLLGNGTLGRARGAWGAGSGTLFLEEVELLSPELQESLVRVLRAGDPAAAKGESRAPDASPRVIATASVDLRHLVSQGRFRDDLARLLDVVEIRVPPLRERPEDILPMARHFIEFFSRVCGRRPPRLSDAVEAMLVQYPWPGNVRELRNAIERAVLFCDGELLEPPAFRDSVPSARPNGTFVGGPCTLEAIEREHIMGVLARAKTLDEAASILGIDKSTLWRKRKRYEDEEAHHVMPPSRPRHQSPALRG